MLTMVYLTIKKKDAEKGENNPFHFLFTKIALKIGIQGDDNLPSL